MRGASGIDVSVIKADFAWQLQTKKKEGARKCSKTWSWESGREIIRQILYIWINRI